MRKSTMKRLFIFLSVCLLVSTAYGTAQIPERLLYRGREYPMACVPLEAFFDANHPKPEEFRPGPTNPTRTSCWRRYVGTWEIKDKTLYLKSLGRPSAEFDSETGKLKERMEQIPLSLIFKDRKPPIKATWYTGALRLPQGNLLRYVHMGFESIHEKDLYIGIRRGNVVSENVVDNKGKGATRSTSDLQWVALGPKPVKDDFKWHDARVVVSGAFAQSRESGKSFRTRGIYLKDENTGIAKLWIPPTPRTRPVTILFESMPENHKGKAGEHVEITAHFEKGLGGHSLNVDSIRPLKPGETMHHRDFGPANKKPADK